MNFSTLLSFAIILAVLVTVDACPSKFKNSTEKVLRSCVTMLKLDMQKFLDIIEDPEKDDKCLSKCFLEKMDAVKGDKLDMDGLNAYLEEQAPKQLLTKLTEVASKCQKTSTEKLDGKEKLAPGEVCMAFHSFYACFMVNATKLC